MKLLKWKITTKYYEEEKEGFVFAETNNEAKKLIADKLEVKPIDIEVCFTEIFTEVSNRVIEKEEFNFMTR
jgi:hypothetical protein